MRLYRAMSHRHLCVGERHASPAVMWPRWICGTTCGTSLWRPYGPSESSVVVGASILCRAQESMVTARLQARFDHSLFRQRVLSRPTQVGARPFPSPNSRLKPTLPPHLHSTVGPTNGHAPYSLPTEVCHTVYSAARGRKNDAGRGSLAIPAQVCCAVERTIGHAGDGRGRLGTLCHLVLLALLQETYWNIASRCYLASMRHNTVGDQGVDEE